MDEQTIFKDSNAQTDTSTADASRVSGQNMADTNLPPAEQKKLKKEAHKEAIKDVLVQQETNRQKLENLVKKSEQKILEISTVFPFTLFPDRLVITEEKVSVIHQIFFYSEQVRSVLGKDIANVTVQTGIFFATLTILDRYFAEDPISMHFLKKSEALEARRIIQGMIVTGHQGIDITKINIPDIGKKLEVIGKAAI
jgi:hypothetical protein